METDTKTVVPSFKPRHDRFSGCFTEEPAAQRQHESDVSSRGNSPQRESAGWHNTKSMRQQLCPQIAPNRG
jgi:hypothetical protein